MCITFDCGIAMHCIWRSSCISTHLLRYKARWSRVAALKFTQHLPTKPPFGISSHVSMFNAPIMGITSLLDFSWYHPTFTRRVPWCIALNHSCISYNHISGALMVQTLQNITDSRMQKACHGQSELSGLQKSQSLFVPFQSRCHMAVLFLVWKAGMQWTSFLSYEPFPVLPSWQMATHRYWLNAITAGTDIFWLDHDQRPESRLTQRKSSVPSDEIHPRMCLITEIKVTCIWCIDDTMSYTVHHA